MPETIEQVVLDYIKQEEVLTKTREQLFQKLKEVEDLQRQNSQSVVATFLYAYQQLPTPLRNRVRQAVNKAGK
jgi:hypothetical protein